jgi:nucleoside-diphosphate-sugar epimerase
MNIIVTGGSGFIGKNLIPKLLSLGHKVSIIDISCDSIEAYPWFKKINFFKLRIDSNDICKVLKKINAEVLIHLAWSDLPNYENIIHFKNNLYQQIKFLTYNAENNIKKIIVSGTCLEYGLIDGCLDESMKTKPTTFYGFAKNEIRKTLDFLSTKYDFSYIWFRLFYIYGENQNPKSLYPSLINSIKKNETSFKMSSGKQIRDFIHISEVVEYFCLAVADLKTDGIINLSSGTGISVQDFVKKIIKKHNSDIRIEYDHYDIPLYEPKNFWGCNRLLKKLRND